MYTQLLSSPAGILGQDLTMSQLPTGTVTFLFTDIEGSTRLLEELGDRYHSVNEDHLTLVGGAITGAGGTVVRTEGDAFFAVFSSAIDAVGAAVEAQLRLGSHAWPDAVVLKVRMGLHTGLGTLGGEDYVGLDVHRAARLADAAHGGQIVVAESTHALVREDLSEQISFLDLGAHKLKDLSRTEPVYQVLHPLLPAEFPPLRHVEGFPNNLPVELSSFLGREETLRGVQEAMDASRLVTLIGPGGVGKTRLALQVAADRVERHPDGVWLVELAGLADPDLVPQAVRSALGIPEQAGRSAVATLTGYLERRDVLLALDNCEHLIDATAGLVETVLAASPGVRVLATSREPLNIRGEVTWPVPPMTLPPPDDAVVIGNPPEAVALFVERARGGDPAFNLTEGNARSIANICRHLDGLPLAIELAAARVRALSVEDIATRLENRLAVLSAGSRTAVPRQQTLKATVEWSYDLLGGTERILFTRLSVFAGSFDLSAAEDVGAGGDIERHQVLDLLTGLVDKSLFAVVHDEKAVRYRLLETIRNYARSRLAETSEMPQVEEAHTRWAVGFAEQAGEQIIGPEMRSWLRRIRVTFDDLRAVLDRSIARGDAETGLRLLTDLEVYFVGNAVREGSYWLDRLLATGEVDLKLLARALTLRGELLAFQGDVDSAVPELERSLELFETIDYPSGQAFAQIILGIAVWGRSEPERVRQLFASSLEPLQTSGNLAGVVRCLFALAMWEFEFGDLTEAARFVSQLEALGDKSGVPLIKAHAAETHALAAHFAGDREQARLRFLEAIAHHRKTGFIQCLAHCIEHIALWTIDTGSADQAAILLGSVETLRQEHVGTAVPPFERIWHDQAITAARQQLGAPAFERLFSEGSQTGPDEATELASAVLLGSSTGSTPST